MVRTIDASAYYRDRLGSELLHVPSGTADRLKQWPALEPTNATVQGVQGGVAAADLVLSSAGEQSSRTELNVSRSRRLVILIHFSATIIYSKSLLIKSTS